MIEDDNYADGGDGGGGRVLSRGEKLRSFGRDAAERCARAFGLAFVGVYLAGGFGLGSLADAAVREKAVAAGIAAVGSLVVSFVAKRFGPSGPDSAGFTT
jgi:hypothetical protein